MENIKNYFKDDLEDEIGAHSFGGKLKQKRVAAESSSAGEECVLDPANFCHSFLCCCISVTIMPRYRSMAGGGASDLTAMFATALSHCPSPLAALLPQLLFSFELCTIACAVQERHPAKG